MPPHGKPSEPCDGRTEPSTIYRGCGAAIAPSAAPTGAIGHHRGKALQAFTFAAAELRYAEQRHLILFAVVDEAGTRLCAAAYDPIQLRR
jgi:hypothetical protein